MERFAIVEKQNHLAVHGLFYQRDFAEYFLRDCIPVYVVGGYFANKTLTKDSFEVIDKLTLSKG